MKRPKRGSTVKQYAYATRRLNGQGGSKREIALLSGYSKSMAENAKYKIEETEGYQNAVIVLANESNNLLLAVLSEFKARGLKEFSNADLTKALNAISGAWDRIEKTRSPQKLKDPEINPLRAIFTRRVETQTAVIEPMGNDQPTHQSNPVPTPTPTPVPVEDVVDMDF